MRDHTLADSDVKFLEQGKLQSENFNAVCYCEAWFFLVDIKFCSFMMKTHEQNAVRCFESSKNKINTAVTQ